MVSDQLLHHAGITCQLHHSCPVPLCGPGLWIRFLTFISATPWNPSVYKTCLPMIIVLLEIIIARVHIGQPRLRDGRKCGRFNTVRPVQKRLSLRASVLGQKLLVRTFALEVGNDSFITTRADC